jgi:hypothetical protein
MKNLIISIAHHARGPAVAELVVRRHDTHHHKHNERQNMNTEVVGTFVRLVVGVGVGLVATLARVVAAEAAE